MNDSTHFSPKLRISQNETNKVNGLKIILWGIEDEKMLEEPLFCDVFYNDL